MDHKQRQWVYFIVGFLIGSGECETYAEAEGFAKSLEDSFNEEYRTAPVSSWPEMARKDLAEYRQSVKDHAQ